MSFCRAPFPPDDLAPAVTAAVVLTGCGGGQAEPDDGEESGAAASAGARPGLDLPDDVELSFASDTPSDARHAAALGDAENYLRALAHGIVAQAPEDDAYRFYSEGQAARYAEEQIRQWVDGEWTATGKDRYHRAKTADIGDFRECRR
ncbi:hypothetical protein [Streptomyces albidoflavus]|uniref:hypothetical protein n=1 Tax=Streptomyces albidoflavus TaxID=1886 RepID=UPI0033A71838